MLRHVQMTSLPVCEIAEYFRCIAGATANNGASTVCGRSGTLQADGHDVTPEQVLDHHVTDHVTDQSRH